MVFGKNGHKVRQNEFANLTKNSTVQSGGSVWHKQSLFFVVKGRHIADRAAHYKEQHSMCERVVKSKGGEIVAGSKFDIRLSDSQATPVTPIKSAEFDRAAYVAYEKEKSGVMDSFLHTNSGVLVYRRMRAGDCFSGRCREMQHSLELQLGALQKSMSFASDIPNFLEPWFGIGVLASAFGLDYIWHDNAAPTMRAKYKTLQELLAIDPVPLAQTAIGKHNLHMAEYFVEQTQGELPLSFCDIQSPLNTAGNIMDINQFFMDCFDEPDTVRELLDRMADQMVAYLCEMHKVIGDALVRPGHGFASARGLAGLGVSDDNVCMLSPAMYANIASKSIERLTAPFGGLAFHSCGNYADKLPVVKGLKGLKGIDAAFTPQTDPDPNDPELFGTAVSGTNIILNARMVGDAATVIETVRKIWHPPMRLIAVTYCSTPDEQQRVYEQIHALCS
jgi:hypothetical protein